MFIKTSDAEETASGNHEHEETLGDFLRRARLSQGLELGAIALETRINENNLRALEENNRAGLPADVFSRGFVKLYASYLKLDVQQAIHLYEQQWGASGSLLVPILLHRSASSFAWPGIIVTLLLIALFFGIRIYYPGQGEPSGGQENSGSPLVSNAPDAVKDEVVPPAPSAPAFGSDQPLDSVPAVSSAGEATEAFVPAVNEQVEILPITPEEGQSVPPHRR